MTLHESIEMVLQNNGKPMISTEIAEIINSKNLYIRKDNIPVSASQIFARVKNYPLLFSIDSGKIKLVIDDALSLKFENYKNQLIQEFEHNFKNNIYFRNANKIDILKNTIKKSLNNKTDDDSDIVAEPQGNYGNTETNSELEVIYRLCNWYVSQGNNLYGNLRTNFVHLLSKLEWFNNSNNVLVTDIVGFNNFLLKFKINNTNAAFQIKANIQNDFVPIEKEIESLNNYIIEIINNSNVPKYNNLNTVITGLFIPPFGKKNKGDVPTEFKSILSEINSNLNNLDKAILIIPIGLLYSSNKSCVQSLEQFIKSNTLDAVVELPQGIIENTAIKTALLIFDFNRKSTDTVFFFDSTQLEKKYFSKAIDIINSKLGIDSVSKKVTIEDIKAQNFNLYPKNYVLEATEIELGDGKKIYNLGELIFQYKLGRNFDSTKRNLFYIGGEYKYIRISDINNENIYFYNNDSTLGLDHDQISKNENELVSGGLVLSALNNSIKINILPDDEKFIIGYGVYWLKVNEDLVLESYLAEEFKQHYIQKQIETFSTGASITRINGKDLLKIKFIIPSIAEQKDFLIKKIKSLEQNTEESKSISEKELDFIKTLKHTLKQPTAGLSNDFTSLYTFIKNKIESAEPFSFNETIVPVFKNDSPDTLKMYSLKNTLSRMERAISDIDYNLEQADKIMAISHIQKKNIELKSFLENLKKDYPSIIFIIKGKKFNVFADEKQFRILFQNLIENAIKHGFKEMINDKIIWIEINTQQEETIQISVRNNGKSLPDEFTIDDFLAKGKSTNPDVGSGFGGFLIANIIKNHKGTIHLTSKNELEILPYNVEFKISLPKN